MDNTKVRIMCQAYCDKCASYHEDMYTEWGCWPLESFDNNNIVKPGEEHEAVILPWWDECNSGEA